MCLVELSWDELFECRLYGIVLRLTTFVKGLLWLDQNRLVKSMLTLIVLSYDWLNDILTITFDLNESNVIAEVCNISHANIARWGKCNIIGY